ncbi:MAG: DUF1588 domain-containing protein [Polyangiaceae bacterium]|nr:DUF1588 domain-containing protein [Polyangiaceae bacterium]
MAPFEPTSVPPGFDSSVLGEAPQASDAVSKDWHQTVDQIAQASAKLLAEAPLGLACPITEFGRDVACTQSYLTEQALRYLRGRANPNDVDRLLQLATAVQGRSGGAAALKVAVRAMALSPKFIYLTEGLDRSLPATTPARMSVEELASFLAFRIGRRPPSTLLLQVLAQAPALDNAQLSAIIEQEFTPAERAQSTTDFLAAWLNVAALSGSVSKDLSIHPQFTSEFLLQLQRETYDTLHAQFVAPGNGDLKQLLTENVESTLLDDKRNPLVQTYKRPGVLALPGFIASISSPQHTGLPKRGKFLVNAFFCDGAQPPPAGIKKPDFPPGLSERQQFEMIEQLPGCGPCHTRINPLAYPFERYDEVGNPRAADAAMNVIDTSGAHALTSGGPRDFVYSDLQDLGVQMSGNSVVQTCLSIQAFEYTARRTAASPYTVGRNDSCAVSSIKEAGALSGFQLTGLLRDALIANALAPRAD